MQQILGTNSCETLMEENIQEKNNGFTKINPSLYFFILIRRKTCFLIMNPNYIYKVGEYGNNVCFD